MEGVELTLRGREFKKIQGVWAHVRPLLETLFPAVGGRAFRGVCPHCGSQSCAYTLTHSLFSLQIRIS